MKRILLFAALVGLIGQTASSTCKSRCEEEIGKGDVRCDKMCAGMDEKPRRVNKPKAPQNDAEARAAFAEGAKQAAAASAKTVPSPAGICCICCICCICRICRIDRVGEVIPTNLMAIAPARNWKWLVINTLAIAAAVAIGLPIGYFFKPNGEGRGSHCRFSRWQGAFRASISPIVVLIFSCWGIHAATSARTASISSTRSVSGIESSILTKNRRAGSCLINWAPRASRFSCQRSNMSLALEKAHG
jgi:hypothetical protein